MPLALDQAGVAFGGFRALSDVTLAVEPGQVIGLIGPNGAGKTTCVNTLTGFQRPTSGRVTLGGRDVSRLSAHAFRRAGVARTFQAGRLFTGLDVLDNLACTGVGLGQRRAAAEHEAEDLLRWMGIADLQSRPAAGLPYTDERRVAIARALMGRPAFLLLDEPAAGMSEKEAADLAALIRRIAVERGTGCLLIEHNVGLVLSVCSHVVVLDGGRVIEQGNRAAILGSRAVREAYLGANVEEA
ncbi:amino acid/amide ABC transporter ATP-binding protein 1, HAAT family [Gemmobacter aquatilis]|uniref:Amino acid/amide ABC transporter ATP-binding protein 1, HAAT family n=1 Tax=Gemmobacter aquatilis TaxID=933059 RepID=A0A1H8A2F3_9RHOB|nr:ABC transporter ATP-binding protein [Gemmobacter aquatilis]SEM64094.1 amino acid/amide ABC transporter ATP-binding protein 1, HAAT family [Gemmobacter aquatilis]